MDLQRHIGLKNRGVPMVKNKEVGNKAYTRKPKSIPPLKHSSKNVTEPKGRDRKEDHSRSSNEGHTSFRLEDEIANIKNLVPLTELLNPRRSKS